MNLSALPLVFGVWARCEDVPDAEPRQRLRESAGAVGGAVVGRYALGPDTVAAEPTQGAQEGGGCGVLALVRQHPT